jgi:enamine deaminase RidA (YjgF/YER057c/UK114 family)
MSRRLISTGSPFETAFGYSRAVIEPPFVFISGTTGYDYASMTMPEDVAIQTRNIFKTVGSVLQEAGSGLDQISRVQIFVTDHAFCEAVLTVCGEVLGSIRPASGIYVVAGLLKPEMKVEIEVTAKLSGH